MEKKVHDLDFLTKAGPYSHIIEANGFYFVSGMVPTDPENGTVITGDVKRATEQALNNIKRALGAVGCGMDRVVKATVYLRDMDDFNAVNEVYRTFFPVNPPARTCIAVKGLPGNAPLEIEVIALK